MAKKEPTVNIENVVASATFKQRFSLGEIAKRIPGTKYNPSEFPGLVMHLEKPKTAILLFSSGKLVCTGARSENQAREAIKKVTEMLEKAGIKIEQEPEVRVQNIVASANLYSYLDIERIHEKFPYESMYEPEQFPGLIFRMEDPPVVMLLFTSGKVVCTGSRKEEDARRAIYKLRDLLDEEGLLE